jgi:uncharacterized protein (TIGR03437 family)
VNIEVTAGDPTPAAVQACSAGAIGVITGSWLANTEKASDLSGQSIILGGTKVLVNGQYVPVLQASVDRVEFLCPQVGAGTTLQVAVDVAGFVSQSLTSVMQSVSPRILTLNDQNQDQGLAYVSGTRNLAMVRNAEVPAAYPAQPGDSLLIWGTGFGSADDVAAGKVTVSIDGNNVPVKSIAAVAGHAGVYAIEVQAPAPASFDEPVSLQVQTVGADGSAVTSNTVRIAMEPAAQ